MLNIDFVSKFRIFFWDNLLKILLSLVVVVSFVLVPTLMTRFYDNNSTVRSESVAEKLVQVDEKVFVWILVCVSVHIKVNHKNQQDVSTDRTDGSYWQWWCCWGVLFWSWLPNQTIPSVQRWQHCRHLLPQWRQVCNPQMTKYWCRNYSWLYLYCRYLGGVTRNNLTINSVSRLGSNKPRLRSRGMT